MGSSAFSRRSYKRKPALLFLLTMVASACAFYFLIKHGTSIERLKNTAPLTPWGYNKERNVVRMLALQKSILNDIRKGVLSTSEPFSVVDYGSDKGYFSINIAVMFPNAHVMSIELGGVGGEIWKKNGDVLALQDQLIESHGVMRQVQICQTRVKPEQFRRLNEAEFRVDYQLLLSVFHWFALADKESFQRVLVDVLLNANIATFIELPVLGNNSHFIRKQVGYKYFKKWYEGSDGDIKKVINDALLAHNIRATVASISRVPWASWYRELYRVEVMGERKPFSFACEERRKIYRCLPREHHNTCTNSRL